MNDKKSNLIQLEERTSKDEKAQEIISDQHFSFNLKIKALDNLLSACGTMIRDIKALIGKVGSKEERWKDFIIKWNEMLAAFRDFIYAR